MDGIMVSEAQKNLEQLIEQVVEDVEPTIIRTDAGQQVVLLPLDEFNSWQETLYLLSTPANVEHLRRSIKEAKMGLTVERSIPEDETDLHRVGVGRLPRALIPNIAWSMA